MDAAYDYIIAFLGKLYSDGLPDSAGRAGDEHGFSWHINTSFPTPILSQSGSVYREL